MEDIFENIKAITEDVLRLAESDEKPTDNLYDNVKLIHKYLGKFVDEYSNTGGGSFPVIKIIDGNGG